MDDGLIAVVLGIGVGGWVFSKTSRRTGNLLKTSIITAVFVGLLVTFVAFTLLKLVFNK
jgi:hypothetical protein